MDESRIVTSLTLDDLDSMRDLVIGSDFQVVQLTPGPFAAHATRIELGAAVVDVGGYNQAVRLHGITGADTITFVFSLQRGGSINGFAVDGTRFVGVGSEAETEAYGSQGVESLNLTLKRAELVEALGDADDWQAIFDAPHAFPVMSERRLMEQFVDDLRVISKHPFGALTGTQERVRGELIYQSLLVHLVHCLSSSRRDKRRSDSTPLHQRFEIVRQAAAYMLSNLDKHIHVADVCRHVGVSERTLQYAFKDVWDSTPMEFLNVHKLNHAHRVLSQTRPAVRSVADIAIECGFWHFGRFAGAYRSLFGVSPSHTLRRDSF
jgi:AraC family ethanolamine operon transcriptional activator